MVMRNSGFRKTGGLTPAARDALFQRLARRAVTVGLGRSGAVVDGRVFHRWPARTLRASSLIVSLGGPFPPLCATPSDQTTPRVVGPHPAAVRSVAVGRPMDGGVGRLRPVSRRRAPVPKLLGPVAFCVVRGRRVDGLLLGRRGRLAGVGFIRLGHNAYRTVAGAVLPGLTRDRRGRPRRPSSCGPSPMS